MAATYLLRRHLATMRSAEKPEAIAERKIAREATARALAECKAAFPTLTADNFEEANEYREQRVAYWMRQLFRDRKPSADIQQKIVCR